MSLISVVILFGGQVVSLAAVGLAVDASATSEAAAACSTAIGLLDELFPAVLAALRHDDDAAAMTVVPFLQVTAASCW